MEQPRFRRQLSDIPENETYRPQCILIGDFPKGKSSGICQANRKLVYTIASVVLLGLAFSFGFFIGRSGGLAHLFSLQKSNNTVWCSDEDIDFKGANLIPKQSAQDISTTTPSSSPQMNTFKRDCERHVMPSAHLYLNYTLLENDKSQLPWTKNTPFSRGTGHRSAEVIYRPKYGGLEVTQGGIYNVYCHMTFQPTSNRDTRFVQCLFRVSPENMATPEEVVCTQTTKMNVTDVKIVQPIRLQAAIKLNTGDILFVKVSDIASVFGSYNNNYFGIFKIS